MTADSRKITVIAVVVALLLVVGFGVSVYHKKKQRELRNAVAVLVKDSSARMRDAIGIEGAPPTVDRARFVKQLEGHAATAERNLQSLQRLNDVWNRALVRAADGYLLTAQETLKRQAASHRHRLLLLESGRELREHMGKNERTGAWVADAVKLKERAEKDYRDYRLAVAAYTKLLEQFPAAQDSIEPYFGPQVMLPETGIAQAGRGAHEIEKQMNAEIEKLRKLHPGR